MMIGTEHIENELKCPYCKGDEIYNKERLEGALIHCWVSCKKCGRNFQALKQDNMFSIINGDQR